MAPLVTLLSPILGTLIDRLIPDKHEAEKAKLAMEMELVKAANEVNLAQIENNKIEAGHRSIWVAGWRPAIGWSCAAGFAWTFIGQPLVEWILILQGQVVELPHIDPDILLEMTFAMLGLAGMRSWEKSRGLTK